MPCLPAATRSKKRPGSFFARRLPRQRSQRTEEEKKHGFFQNIRDSGRILSFPEGAARMVFSWKKPFSPWKFPDVPLSSRKKASASTNTCALRIIRFPKKRRKHDWSRRQFAVHSFRCPDRKLHRQASRGNLPQASSARFRLHQYRYGRFHDRQNAGSSPPWSVPCFSELWPGKC